MSRDISTTNLAEINASHVHLVTMVALDFDTPVYVHSGIGTIEFGAASGGSTGNVYNAWKGAVEPTQGGGSGNEYQASKGAVEPIWSSTTSYLGVGDFGGISEAKASEVLGPASLTLTLTGIDNSLITEAQEAGRYRDSVTIYQGYRQDDGTLVDDPWIAWKGFFEYASIKIDEESTISVTCHHDLSVLTEKDGSRFSSEDQERRYSGDKFFQFVTDQSGLRLFWGGTTHGGDRFGDREPPPGGRIY